MKIIKMSYTILIIILVLMLTSCKINNYEEENYEDIVQSIEKPENDNLIVSGSFETVDMIKLTELSDEIIEKYDEAPKLYLNSEFMQFGDMYSFDPEFKSRYLNYNNLLQANNVDLKDIINKEEGPVLTVSDGQFIYQNIYVLDDEHIALVNDGILFRLEKISDQVPDQIIESAKNKSYDKKIEDDKETEFIDLNSAVFLALKTPMKDKDDRTYYDYYSIMIRRDENNNYSLYGIEDIFVPEKNGIFLAGIDHIVEDGSAEDKFFYRSLNVESDSQEYKNIGEGGSNQILYIGNGYINIETKEYDSVYKKYRLYNSQKLDLDESLSVADIAGEDGLESYVEDTAKAINKNNIDANTIDLIDIYNIGMTRNKGVWQYKSNLIVSEKDQLVVTDYLVDIVPTVNITNDSLAIPWEDIQTKFPNAIDAYTSPQEDLLIVHSRQEILAYEIKDGIIGENKIFSISIGEYDQIILNEWVSGALVNEWSNIFTNQDRIALYTIK